ncbi:MAG: hypothetical protein R6V25_13165 [Desulfatiglandales bacterium]
MSGIRVKLICCMVLCLLFVRENPLGSGLSIGPVTNVCLAQNVSEEKGNEEGTDIQWFREKMRISPKYLDQEEGVLGMSWAHFLTMLFLVLFFIISLVAIVIRHRRTRQLLDILLKEEEKSGTEG